LIKIYYQFSKLILPFLKILTVQAGDLVFIVDDSCGRILLDKKDGKLGWVSTA
jgi:hypothetical protein